MPGRSLLLGGRRAIEFAALPASVGTVFLLFGRYYSRLVAVLIFLRQRMLMNAITATRALRLLHGKIEQ